MDENKVKIFVLVLIVYMVHNFVTIIVYGLDKRYAIKQTTRIPEKTLMGLAFWFGGPGAFLGMQFFRHKTKHLQFQILVPVFMGLQLIIWTVVALNILE